MSFVLRLPAVPSATKSETTASSTEAGGRSVVDKGTSASPIGIYATLIHDSMHPVLGLGIQLLTVRPFLSSPT